MTLNDFFSFCPKSSISADIVAYVDDRFTLVTDQSRTVLMYVRVNKYIYIELKCLSSN